MTATVATLESTVRLQVEEAREESVPLAGDTTVWGEGRYYYGFRDYSPMQMRFTTTDPIRSGANWYAYVGGDPVNYVDPWGLETVVMSIDVGPWEHLFIAQQDEETGEVNTLSLHPAGGIPAGIVSLLPLVSVPAALTPNMGEELEAAEAYFSGADLAENAQYQSTPPVPEGMTQAQFDERVKEEGDQYEVDRRPYEARLGPNSNTYVDDVIERAGSSLPDVAGAVAQNWGEPDPCEGATH